MSSPPPDGGLSLAELRHLPSPEAMVIESVEAGSQRPKRLEDVTRPEEEVTDTPASSWPISLSFIINVAFMITGLIEWSGA